ncbi:MAG: hypothetical protein ACOX4J_03670 [Anaerovoracaceae bacterium]
MDRKSLVALCSSIVLGFTILGAFIFCGMQAINMQKEELIDRYQIISHGDNILVFDKQTADYWQKYLPQFEGPTEWEKYEFPYEVPKN